jgi:hypothetical protein
VGQSVQEALGVLLAGRQPDHAGLRAEAGPDADCANPYRHPMKSSINEE